jgi:hypothetical protein
VVEHSAGWAFRAATAVLAIDWPSPARSPCTPPAMEGGIAVAPASFGRYGGDLVAAREASGRIFAVSLGGAVATLAASGLPRGRRHRRREHRLRAARARRQRRGIPFRPVLQGQPAPRTNCILRLPGAELIPVGFRPGDALAATEASARTIAVRCGHRCTVRYVAIGPAISAPSRPPARGQDRTSRYGADGPGRHLNKR